MLSQHITTVAIFAKFYFNQRIRREEVALADEFTFAKVTSICSKYAYYPKVAIFYLIVKESVTK